MGKFRQQIVDFFGLSPEIAMDLPLIMMVGDEQIYLENHKGISHFKDVEIKIKINQGFLVFTGENLVVDEINSESISISGKIHSLFYETRFWGDRS
ncbi:MAG: YabP/YqfC family sporulation protein [Halanaerobiales bacterium]